VGSQSLVLSKALLDARPALRGYRDRKVIVGIRPEHLLDAALGPVPAPGTTLTADVELIEALGNELQVHFLLDATRVRSEDAQAAAETHELEGLQSLQGGTRAEGVPGSRPEVSSRPDHVRPSPSTQSGSTSSTTRAGQPSGADGPGPVSALARAALAPARPEGWSWPSDISNKPR